MKKLLWRRDYKVFLRPVNGIDAITPLFVPRETNTLVHVIASATKQNYFSALITKDAAFLLSRRSPQSCRLGGHSTQAENTSAVCIALFDTMAQKRNRNAKPLPLEVAINAYLEIIGVCFTWNKTFPGRYFKKAS